MLIPRNIMQLKKLAVICNACFWLTLIFQVWKHARDIHQSILNTVVVLGILAVVINLCWITMDVIRVGKSSSQKNIKAGETTISRNERVFKFFNLISFTSQIILLVIKLI
jgi:hypothetical protein